MAPTRALCLAALLLLAVADVSLAMKPPAAPKKPTPPVGAPAAAPAAGPKPKKKKMVLPPAAVISTAARDLLRQKLKEAGGCNANVCFAIDGSRRMPPKQFKMEKDFVLDVVSIIGVDQPVEVSAMQYGTGRSPIVPLTVDTAQFNLRVQAARQVGGKSFTRGGIEFCARQLDRRPGEANKMVLLTDGLWTGRNPVRRAIWFRRRKGDMAVVGAGRRDEIGLLALTGWNRQRLFDVGNFLDVLRIENAIKQLVSQICNVGGKRKFFPDMGKPAFPGKAYKMKLRKKRWDKYCKVNECSWKDSR